MIVSIIWKIAVVYVLYLLLSHWQQWDKMLTSRHVYTKKKFPWSIQPYSRCFLCIISSLIYFCVVSLFCSWHRSGNVELKTILSPVLKWLFWTFYLLSCGTDSGFSKNLAYADSHEYDIWNAWKKNRSDPKCRAIVASSFIC